MFKWHANANPGFALAVYVVVGAHSKYQSLMSFPGRCLCQEHLKEILSQEMLVIKRFDKRAGVNRPNRGHFTTGLAGNT